MAADWIKWVKGLTKRREVLAMASALKKDRRLVAAICMEVWEWADENTQDGEVYAITFAFLDEMVGVRGFMQAMSDTGWVVERPGGIMFPNWDRHNGTSAKRRALDRERKREESPKNLHGVSASKAEDSRSRLDQRREEEKREEPTTVVDSPGDVLVLVGGERAKEPSEMLRAAGVNGVALSFFSSHKSVTASVVRDACAPYKGKRAPPGIVVNRICNAIGQNVPSKLSIDPELRSLEKTIRMRQQRV
jgi:hypothetical protein